MDKKRKDRRSSPRIRSLIVFILRMQELEMFIKHQIDIWMSMLTFGDRKQSRG